MTTFIQLHMLIDYPPSNPNRDDLGRPKTAVVGGHERMRISSQALKRAWRTSDLFQDAMRQSTGVRTKKLGTMIYDDLIEMPDADADSERASRVALDVARGIIGDTSKTFKGVQTDEQTGEVRIESEQLLHFSQDEIQRAKTYAREIYSSDSARKFNKKEAAKEVLGDMGETSAADVAMFGRMIATSPEANIEAAVQVAHAFATHPTRIESDYFTAVDDVFDPRTAGSAHIGETGFGSAIFYQYVCVDWDSLVLNLGGDDELAQRALDALVQACMHITPDGKKNAFAHQSRVKFMLAQRGQTQPCSLFSAFLKPLGRDDHMEQAAAQLMKTHANLAQAYEHEDDHVIFSAVEAQGVGISPLSGVTQFLTKTREVARG